ncbi:ABC transporter permease [Anaerococcus provencensis]|uniref:ABC transporter permease n=1 Tax=Anaerococcus provencensis TaxID=938293 RepID=UPI0002F9A185|nr:ABC transporter permease subunit [Anaerococcus provencensis]
MFKLLNPKRFYHTVGKNKFFEFILSIVFFLFFYLPLLNAAMLAFANKYQFPYIFPNEWGFNWWNFIIDRDNLISSILSSVIIAILVTIFSLLICLPAAYALARYEFKGKSLVLFSYLLTNAFPKMGLYVSIAIIYYKLGLMGTYTGVIIIHIINTIMYMVWLPLGSFRSVRKEQEEAARDVGASPLRTFKDITLPLAMPGIAVASVFTFLASMDEAQGTLVVGFPQISTMATEMYAVIMDFPITAGAVFSLLLMIPSIIVIFLFRKYITADAIQIK